MKILTDNLIDFDIFEDRGYIALFNHYKSQQSVYDKMIIDFSHSIEFNKGRFDFLEEMSLAMKFRRRYKEGISILTIKSKLFLELEKLIKEMKQYEELSKSKFYTTRVAQSYIGDILYNK